MTVEMNYSVCIRHSLISTRLYCEHEKKKCLWSVCLPGDNSETGVLEGVGLCPPGRKWEGEPLLEPLPVPPANTEKKIKIY